MKKYFLSLKNRRGAALVYVLMALVCVGAVSSLVLNSAKSETTDNALRSSSESSRFSAAAGLTWATNFFTDTTPEAKTRAEKVLNIWYQNYNKNNAQLNAIPAEYRWITGARPALSKDSSFLDIDGMRFRVKIVNINFDVSSLTDGTNWKPGMNVQDSKITVLFESEAIDKSGSRARNYGCYTLLGFEDKEKISELPVSTLYMGSGVDEIDVVLDVHGGTFMKGGGDINHSGHTFRGEFKRLGANGELILRGAAFQGPAYFGVLPGVSSSSILIESNPSTFKKGLGLSSESSIITSGSMCPIIDNCGAFLNGNAVTAGGVQGNWLFQGPNSKIIGVTGKNYGNGTGIPGIEWLYKLSGTPPAIAPVISGEMELFTLLEIFESDPPAIKINMEKIKPYIKIFNSSNKINGKIYGVTGDDLNELYNEYPGELLEGKWMVIKAYSDGTLFSSTGSGFKERMILIIDEKTNGNIASQFYRSAETGISLIIVENGAPDIGQLGHNTLIRGLIANLGSKKLNITSSGSNMTISGGVFSVGTGAVRMEGGPYNKITIKYDEPALREMVNDSLISNVGGGGESTGEYFLSRIPKELYPKARTELLSRSF